MHICTLSPWFHQLACIPRGTTLDNKVYAENVILNWYLLVKYSEKYIVRIFIY